MEQGKSLILKLFGVALGLVVMLAGATVLSQNFMAGKSISLAGSEKQFSAEAREVTLSMNEEFRIVVESGGRLTAPEDQMVSFSYKITLPQSKYITSGKCTGEETEYKPEGRRKAPAKALYWI